MTRITSISGSTTCHRCSCPAVYILKFNTDHGGAFSAFSVCVTLTNLACTGRKVATEVAPDPVPSATGALHEVPSIDT